MAPPHNQFHPYQTGLCPALRARVKKFPPPLSATPTLSFCLYSSDFRSFGSCNMGGGKAGKAGKGQNAPFEDPTTEQRYQRLLDQLRREGKPPISRARFSRQLTHTGGQRDPPTIKPGTPLHLRQPEGRGLTTSRLKGHRLRRTHLPQLPDLSYKLRCPRLARPRHSRLRSPHLKLALRSRLCQQRLLQLRLRSPHLATKLRLTWSSNTWPGWD